MNENNIDIIKAVVGLAIGSSVSVVVKNAIVHTSPEEMDRNMKVAVSIGTWALAGMASLAAAKHVESKIDSIVGMVKTVTEKFQKKDEPSEEEQAIDPAI